MIEAKKARYNKEGIVIGAEPIEHNKGDVLVFLVHGFSSSPDELRELAGYLRDRDISVFAPLLPGHGTKPEDLKGRGYRDWYRYAENQLKKAISKKKYRKVFVGGLCSGANIAINLGVRYKEKIDGLVLVSTPIFFRKNLIYRIIHPLFKLFPGYYIKLGEDPRLKEALMHGTTYNRFSMKFLYDVYKMADRSKKDVKMLEKPVLILQSKKDHVINHRSAEYVKIFSRSEKKRLVMYDKPGHVLLRHNENNDINQEILSFIKEISKVGQDV